MTDITFTRTFRLITLMLVACFLALIVAPVDAGNRSRNVPTRNTTRTNFSGGGNRNTNINTNRNVNVNTNRNVNVNRNTNVNVNVHNHGRYYGGGYYGGCCYNTGPSVGAVVAATVTTAIVVGAIVSSLPPNCTTIIANGITYQNCGGTYYQPQYSSGNVQYVVVNHP